MISLERLISWYSWNCHLVIRPISNFRMDVFTRIHYIVSCTKQLVCVCWLSKSETNTLLYANSLALDQTVIFKLSFMSVESPFWPPDLNVVWMGASENISRFFFFNYWPGKCCIKSFFYFFLFLCDYCRYLNDRILSYYSDRIL